MQFNGLPHSKTVPSIKSLPHHLQEDVAQSPNEILHWLEKQLHPLYRQVSQDAQRVINLQHELLIRQVPNQTFQELLAQEIQCFTVIPLNPTSFAKNFSKCLHSCLTSCINPKIFSWEIGCT